jgi:PadR family transcriptional regulator AphA
MSLHDVLLSLLREPMSGTELIEAFQSSIRHFWQADLSQIYRALESLETEGAVRSRSVPSPRGPARRVYRLTPAGRRRLIDWVRRQPHIPSFKFEYLAQLFSVTAEERPRERAVEILTALGEESRASLTVLEGLDAAFAELPGYPDRLPTFIFYPWLTLRHGMHRRRALVEWIDECLRRLESRPAEIDAADPDAIAALGALLAEFSDLTNADGPTAEAGSGQEKA